MSQLSTGPGTRSPESASVGADATERVLHGGCVALHGQGVLITGDSGIGKSELALGLLDRGHRLVADDAVRLRCGPGNTLLAQCPPRLRGLLEVRGLGILDIRALRGADAIDGESPVALEVWLCRPSSRDWAAWDRLQGRWDERVLLGRSVPRLQLPVADGRNLPLIVETALALAKNRNAPQRAMLDQKEL